MSQCCTCYAALFDDKGCALHDKPHKGTIRNWGKIHVGDYGADGKHPYVISGTFENHANIAWGHTSEVLTHDEATGEIETRNSRYTLAPQGNT